MTDIAHQGDNKEVTVASISDVTFNFDGNGKSSEDDTATEKYFDIDRSAEMFTLRPNKTVEIVSMDGRTFTDPITVILDTAHTEKLKNGRIAKMVIRTTDTNTLIRLRYR